MNRRIETALLNTTPDGKYVTKEETNELFAQGYYIVVLHKLYMCKVILYKLLYIILHKLERMLCFERLYTTQMLCSKHIRYVLYILLEHGNIL